MVQENGTDMQLKSFLFSPLGKRSNLTYIFQMARNHQIENHWFCFILCNFDDLFFHFGSMPGQEPDGELCGKLQFL